MKTKNNLKYASGVKSKIMQTQNLFTFMTDRKDCCTWRPCDEDLLQIELLAELKCCWNEDSIISSNFAVIWLFQKEKPSSRTMKERIHN